MCQTFNPVVYPFTKHQDTIFSRTPNNDSTQFPPQFLVHGSNTLTVSAFYCANADIRPSQYVPIWWALYPPRKEEFEWLFNLGTKKSMIGTQ